MPLGSHACVRPYRPWRAHSSGWVRSFGAGPVATALGARMPATDCHCVGNVLFVMLGRALPLPRSPWSAYMVSRRIAAGLTMGPWQTRARRLGGSAPWLTAHIGFAAIAGVFTDRHITADKVPCLDERAEVCQDASARRPSARLHRPSSRSPRAGRDEAAAGTRFHSDRNACSCCPRDVLLRHAGLGLTFALGACAPEATERLERLFARGVVVATHYSGRGAAEMALAQISTHSGGIIIRRGCDIGAM